MLTSQTQNLENRIAAQRQGAVGGWLKIFVLVLIGLGIIFRFSHLDTKPYWFDEVSTSVQTSGYGDVGAQARLVTGMPISVAEIQATQYPASGTSVVGTVQGLAIKEPQLTPLYFMLSRWWVQLFGHSITAMRSLSAVLSVLTLPCLYWLCRELFRSKTAPWIALALFSVSPFHLIYAQEARPSSFWTLTLVLSSAVLLWAMRQGGIGRWLLYALTLVVGLYGHIFTLLVMLSHGLYVALCQRLRFGRSLMAYGVASGVAIAAFMPWIVWAVLPNRAVMASQSGPMSLPEMLKAGIRGFSLIFVDFSLNDTSPKLYYGLFLLLVVVLLGLIGYALYFVYRTPPPPTELFILTLTLTPLLLLIGSDILFGASRSVTARYLISTYIGIQLAITYWITAKLTGPHRSLWRRQSYKLFTIALLGVGILSCMTYATSDSWWNKTNGVSNRQMADIINQTAQPVLVSNAYFVELVTLSYELDPKVKVLIVPEKTLPSIPYGFSDIFLLTPTPATLDSLKPDFRVTPIAPNLWKLVAKPV
jgi:uncharacterized membrane protein